MRNFGTHLACIFAGMGNDRIELLGGLWAQSQYDGTFIVEDTKGRRVSQYDYTCIKLITPSIYGLYRKDGRLDILLAGRNWVMGVGKIDECGDFVLLHNKGFSVKVNNEGEIEYIAGKKEKKLVYLGREIKKEGI